MSIRAVVTLAAFAMIAAVAAPASAQGSNDVRCLLASNLYAKGAQDEKARQLAEISKYFYLGRIHGRLNATQLRAAMSAETRTAKTTITPATMFDCARQVQDAAKLATSVAQQIAPKKK